MDPQNWTSGFEKIVKVVYYKREGDAIAMSRKTYTPDFEAKIVLEVLREEKTLEAIASEHDLHPNMLRGWRKEFLENADSIFQPSTKAEKEAKRREALLEKQTSKMLKTIGQLTIERDFLQDCFREAGVPVPELPSSQK